MVQKWCQLLKRRMGSRLSSCYPHLYRGRPGALAGAKGRGFWKCSQLQGEWKVLKYTYIYILSSGNGRSLIQGSSIIRYIMFNYQLFRFVAIGVASQNSGNPRDLFELYARITPEIKKWIKGIATDARDSTCKL